MRTLSPLKLDRWVLSDANDHRRNGLLLLARCFCIVGKFISLRGKYKILTCKFHHQSPVHIFVEDVDFPVSILINFLWYVLHFVTVRLGCR